MCEYRNGEGDGLMISRREPETNKQPIHDALINSTFLHADHGSQVKNVGPETFSDGQR